MSYVVHYFCIVVFHVLQQAGVLAPWEAILVFSQRTSPSHLQPRTTTVSSWTEEMNGGKARGAQDLPVHPEPGL